MADTDVEVVLGGGIFDTDDAGFHARVAAGIHARGPPGRPAAARRAARCSGAALLGLDAIGADDEAKERLRAALTDA